jgi:2-polyprenyl-3-methyl-5-hydroxy-6-metoxy-1,4-benzoquinol methylase
MDDNLQNSCFLCGSGELIFTKYLRPNSDNLLRNIGYMIPSWFGLAFSKFSRRFAAAYKPISINRKYFNRELCFCRNCVTGYALPFLSQEFLTDYYSEFYWNNRDTNEGAHCPEVGRPNSVQIELAANKIAWLKNHNLSFSSVIDFGAGDCASTYVLLSTCSATSVHVVDPSERAKLLAYKYGATYSANLSDAPVVDLIYSSHSIEHVHNLLEVMSALKSKVRVGGYIFLETPNIGDEELFSSFVHTPHTFLISEKSIQHLANLLNLKVVSMQAVGPRWKDNLPWLSSEIKADLRALLQKL